jgi:hypothetical protein
MKSYPFTIIASGLDPTADDFEDRFFEAGCDDATLSFQNGRIILDFSREARSFAHALVSAIRNVRAAGAQVEHIEPDCLVTLSDIAERTNLSRSAVSLFASGARGTGFPAPIARLTTSSPLWDWVQVARWMFSTRRGTRRVVVEARMTKAITDVVNYRSHAEGAFAHSFADRSAYLYLEPVMDHPAPTTATNEETEPKSGV